MRVGAASVVMRVADTLLRAQTGETVDRAPLRAVQTPQGFRREVLLVAHRHAHKHAFGATDDAALVRTLGRPVALVEGERVAHENHDSGGFGDGRSTGSSVGCSLRRTPRST